MAALPFPQQPPFSGLSPLSSKNFGTFWSDSIFGRSYPLPHLIRWGERVPTLCHSSNFCNMFILKHSFRYETKLICDLDQNSFGVHLLYKFYIVYILLNRHIDTFFTVLSYWLPLLIFSEALPSGLIFVIKDHAFLIILHCSSKELVKQFLLSFHCVIADHCWLSLTASFENLQPD